jgi:two-component sensor histidine kinase
MQQTLSAMRARTRALSTPVRYVGTLIVVTCTFLIRWVLDPVLPDFPYLLSFVAILLSATLFNHGTGLLATALSGAFAAYFYLPPLYSFEVAALGDATGLILFLAIGSAVAIVLEALHKAWAATHQAHTALQEAHDELTRSERARGLLLHEFRHRTRNDLASLAGLLLLRARRAPSEAAQSGLREAADHAMVLARVHTRLAPENDLNRDATIVDTRDFIAGLCADLERAQAGDGLRPVSLVVDAEAHSLSTERGVQLGLVLNEAVTNALKYGFPDDRPGTIRVHFRREGSSFVLTVSDDGIGLPKEGDISLEARRPPGSGLGTRLLSALAAQLRGTFTRRPGDCSTGTLAELRFPVEAPALPHY